MRALLFGWLMVLAAPFMGMDAALAQGGAELAAARAASASASAGQGSAAPSPSAQQSAPAATQAQAGDPTDSPALEARGFSYSPEGRRDPFVSLMRRGTNVDARSSASTRALGLKGLGTGEVTLKGTMTSRGAYVAILQGADARTYVVRAGEQLLDGTIRSITADGLVILQQVNDPLSKETHREVRKVLRQTEEAR